MIHFKIITSFYNVEKWIKYTIRSVKNQTYTNFECILTNDMSTDNSLSVARKEIGEDKRFTIIDNTEKKNALENNKNAIELNSKPDDVIVILDGDDWFACSDCLEYLNALYEAEKCWVTYGSYIEFPSKKIGKFSQKCPAAIVENNSYRNNPWLYSHLKTFKYFLWEKIQKEDFINPDSGTFFDFAQDLVYMFPLLEMAGSKVRYVDKILYAYNLTNPINEHKVDHKKQLSVENIVRSRKPYERVYKND